MSWKFDIDRLISLRESKGFTQEEFASAIGTQKQHVSQWETEECMPSTRTLVKIANIFDVVPAYFFTRTETTDPAATQYG